MTFQVADALDAYVAELEEERLPDGRWHPSSLFGCARRAVYDFLGTPKAPLDKRSKRVFRMGHIFHALIQEAVARDPSLKQAYAEVKIVDPERGIEGHADGLIQHADGHWTLLEFKSIRSTGMKYSDLPKDDHQKQTFSYVSVLRKYGGSVKPPGWKEGDGVIVIPPLGDLDHIRYAYISKDDLEIREFDREFTAAEEEWLNIYLLKLKIHVAQGTLPKRLIRLTEAGNVSSQKHYLCSYCPFMARCWSEDGEGVDL